MENRDTSLEILNTDTLKESTTEVVNQIIDEQDINKVKDLTELFNLNQAKKNLVRIVKLNELLDKVQDQAIERINKCPDEIDNKTLLDYMKTVQDSIEKSQKNVSEMSSAPLVQINNQTNEININSDLVLSPEEKERVINAVQQLLQLSKKEAMDDSNIIDVEVEEN